MQHYFYSIYSLGVIHFKLFPFNLKWLSALIYFKSSDDNVFRILYDVYSTTKMWYFKRELCSKNAYKLSVVLLQSQSVNYLRILSPMR
jgi:hypothetical protein